ncbi:hypothetical protein [Brevibacillus daliensis]|uniref:hypothetical protein n=1 Tax=Brevibacillus daliensis TaxID=2892995 RepID=UPI001E44CB5D|nr:hypothetical protein [Brevibacillus daliensis]
MILLTGFLFVLIAIFGNVPTVNALCLVIAALLSVAREFSKNTIFSNSLLFLSIFSIVVLPLFNFWQGVIIPQFYSTSLLVITGLILVVVGLRKRIS